MKKQCILIAFALLGLTSIVTAQNAGINHDGSEPDGSVLQGFKTGIPGDGQTDGATQVMLDGFGTVYTNPGNGHQYALSTTTATWVDAQAACRAAGGYLATVYDADENSFLLTLNLGNSVWIGLSDHETEGTYKWCTNESVTYTNWNTGEPNDANGEDYTEMYTDGKWNDAASTIVRYYIIEISDYTWDHSSSTDWQVAANWTPERTSPTPFDIIRFNSSETLTVTNVPAQTIAEFHVSGNTSVTLLGNSTYDDILTVTDALTTTSGDVIGFGSALVLGGTITNLSHEGALTIDTWSGSSSIPILPEGRTWGGIVEYKASGGTQDVSQGTYNNLTISGNSTKYINNPSTVNGNVLISPGATVSSSDLIVHGSLTNNGGFIGNASTAVTFSGANQQIIGGSGASAFHSVVINNTSTPLLLNANINISGSITINTGTALDLNGRIIGGTAAMTLSGEGIGGGGSLINSSSTAATWPGLITLANNSRITANAGDINIANNILGNYILYLDGSGNGTIGGIIGTGSSSLYKNGAGTWVLSGINTYTGYTYIYSGILEIGDDECISNNSSISFRGGTFSTGTGTGHSETVNRLYLTNNSMIALGTGSHDLAFAASNTLSWVAGKMLTITGWTGGYNGTGGTGGRVFVGTNGTGLTATQLAQIQFFDGSDYYPAAMLTTGEVVPVTVTSSPTDYYRSVTSGIWTAPGIWESSSDNMNWNAATLTPTNQAALITIQAGTSVTLNATNLTASNLALESGSTLNSTSTYVFYVSGNWTNNGGTFNPATGWVEFNGNGPQSIGGSASTSFSQFVISNISSPLVLGADITFQVLRVNAGAHLDLGVYNLSGSATTFLYCGSSSSMISGTSGIFSTQGPLYVNSSGSGSHGASISSNINLGGSIIDVYTYDCDATNDLEISGVISGTGGINKRNSGTLLLSGSNSFSNYIRIYDGRLKLGNDGDASNSPLGTADNGTRIYPGGTLDLNGCNLQVAEPLMFVRDDTSLDSITLTNSSPMDVNYPGLISFLGTSNSYSRILANAGDIHISNTGAIIGTDYSLNLDGSGNGSIASVIGYGIVDKRGLGTWTLSGSNTFVGRLYLYAGHIRIGANECVDNSVDVIFQGGGFNTGETTGFNETLNRMDLNADGTISLGTGIHTLSFAASNTFSWTAGKILTITGWVGGYNGTSGMEGKIFFGSSNTGLTSTQLAQVRFYNGTYYYPATILMTGEVVPYSPLITSAQTGLWNEGATWVGGAAPAPINEVSIISNHTVTIDGDFECMKLDIGDNVSHSTLTFTGTDPSLIVNGPVFIGSNINPLYVGRISFTSGSTLSAPSVTIGTNKTGITHNINVLQMQAGGTLVTGSLAVDNTAGLEDPYWNPGTGSVILMGTNTLPSKVFTSFNNLEISTGITQTGSDITDMTGTLTVNEGATFTLNHDVGANTAPADVVMYNGATTGSTISGTGSLYFGGDLTVYNDGSGTDDALLSCPVNLGTAVCTFLISDGAGDVDLTLGGTVSAGSGGGLVQHGGTLEHTGWIDPLDNGLTITAGYFRLTPSGNLSNDLPVILDGGSFVTGATTGNSENTGTLQLTDNSTIIFGTGDHLLGFKASSGISWTAGKILTVLGWTGPLTGSSGTGGKLRVGTDDTGLTASQLTQIQFYIGGTYFDAIILPDGEVVPDQQTLATDYFRTMANGNWSSLSTWESSPDNSTWIPAEMIPSNDATLVTIRAGHTVTVDVNSSTGSLVIQGNLELGSQELSTYGDFTIDGGTFTYGTGKVTFSGDASQLISSNLTEIDFYDLTINKPSGQVTIDGLITSINIHGDLRVLSGTLNLTDVDVSKQLTVTGDFLQSGGTLNYNAAASPTQSVWINFYGSFIKNGGSVVAQVSGNSIHLYGLNKSIECDGIDHTHFYLDDGALTLSGNFVFNNGTFWHSEGLLDCGTHILSGTSSSYSQVMPGQCTLAIGSPVGITQSASAGNIQTTSRNYLANEYLYNGTSPQVTGDGLPSNVFGLTIDNTGGVTLTNSVMAWAPGLTLGSVLTTGSYTVSVPAGGFINRTTGHVNGNLEIVYGSTGASTETFPIGDATHYTPILMEFDDITTPGSITAYTTGSEHPDIASSGINPAQNANRYWTISNDGTGFTSYDATFTFVPGDLDAGADPLNFIVGKFDAGAWAYPAIGALSANSSQATGMNSFSSFALGESFAPTCLSDPENQTVCAGHPASFSGSATSESAATAAWEVNTGSGWSILTISDPPYSVSTTITGNEYSSTLTIDPTSTNESGYKYRVTFTNPSGACTTDDATLDVFSYTLSGTLKYNNAALTPLDNVELTLTPGGATSTTDAGGYYSFTGLCDGTYTLTVTDNDHSPGSINSTDAAQANVWGVNPGFFIPPIQKVRFFAGDVVQDPDPVPFINSTDATAIQMQYVTGNGSFDRSPWSYWPASIYISANSDPDIHIPADYLIHESISGASKTLNVLAQVTGDFNKSYIPGALKTTSANLYLAHGGNMLLKPGEEYSLPFRTLQPVSFGALSIALDIPAELMEVTSITLAGNTGHLEWMVTGDELRISWVSPVPLSLKANEEMLVIELKTTESFTPGQSIRIELTNDPLNELADERGNVIPGVFLITDLLEASSTGLSNDLLADGLKLSCHPNPFYDHTILVYSIPYEGRVHLEIIDMYGRKVANLLDVRKNAGSYSIKLDAASILPGMYVATLKLDSGKGDGMRSVKIIRAW